MLQRAALAQTAVHLGFEEADRAASFRLGAIERGVGVGSSVTASVPSAGYIAMPMLMPMRTLLPVDLDVARRPRRAAARPAPSRRVGLRVPSGDDRP